MNKLQTIKVLEVLRSTPTRTVIGFEAEDDHHTNLLFADGTEASVFGDAPLLHELATGKPGRYAPKWVVLPLSTPSDTYAAYLCDEIRTLNKHTGEISVGMFERIVDLNKLDGACVNDLLENARHCDDIYPNVGAVLAWSLFGHEVER